MSKPTRDDYSSLGAWLDALADWADDCARQPLTAEDRRNIALTRRAEQEMGIRPLTPIPSVRR